MSTLGSSGLSFGPAVVTSGGATVTRIEISARDARGLPTTLQLEVPPAKSNVEIRLRDVDYDVTLDPSVFELPVPAGVTPEHLEDE